MHSKTSCVGQTTARCNGPDRLWDYLRANLEPSILASPDGTAGLWPQRLWSGVSLWAAMRCKYACSRRSPLLIYSRNDLDCWQAMNCSALVSPKDRIMLSAKRPRQLERWSLTLYKKHLSAYAIFAGSDFDIDEAVTGELADAGGVEFAQLKELAGLQPIVAKRHYHETGALRWFEVNLASASEVVEQAAGYRPRDGAIGQFLLVVPTAGETEKQASRSCREAARQSQHWDIVVGISKGSWTITALARELVALENVRNGRLELAGDAVARREVTARLAALQGQIESELHRAFDNALWFRKHHHPRTCRHTDLNSLASELADRHSKSLRGCTTNLSIGISHRVARWPLKTSCFDPWHSMKASTGLVLRAFPQRADCSSPCSKMPGSTDKVMLAGGLCLHQAMTPAG